MMTAQSPDDGQEKKKIPVPSYKDYAPFLALGIQLAAAVVVFFFIGNFIDQHYGIQPWGKLIGIFLGSAGGFVKFFKTVGQLTEKEKK
jgi:F0F1-type ATP synthase assembly protein I